MADKLKGFMRRISRRYEMMLARHTEKYAEIDQKVKDAEKRLEALKVEREAVAACHPFWGDQLLKNVAETLLRHPPGREYDILGPFGMDSLTSIHFYRKGVPEKKRLQGRNCVSITFKPGDLKRGELFIADERKRHPNDVHGFGCPKVPVEGMSIADMLKWVR